MPIVTIHGVPPQLANTPVLRTLVLESIPNALANIKELGLVASQVTVFVPGDLLSEGLGEELIVTVDGLFVRPERTDTVRYNLAKVLAGCLTLFAIAAKIEFRLIEVLIHPFNPSGGYAICAKFADSGGRYDIITEVVTVMKDDQTVAPLVSEKWVVELPGGEVFGFGCDYASALSHLTQISPVGVVTEQPEDGVVKFYTLSGEDIQGDKVLLYTLHRL